MTIRWNEINPNKGAQLTRPREIYASLQGRRWPRLRPEQNEVLDSWYERRHEDDLVLKQNTGGGKTLTGLLIAQSSLHENIGPAVFIVPDKFLIQQVIDEARAAQIAVAEDLRDERFRSSQAILVTTFHKLLNGRSAFGVRGIKEVIPLGIVVVDDAHSALTAASNLFASTVPDSSPVFGELLKLFANDLRHQSPKSYAEIVDGDYSAPIRVAARSVAERSAEVLRIVSPAAKLPANNSLFYSWPYVADLLKFATITFTTKSVEIKTPCPDIGLIPAFKLARRRVYLTATLEDEGVLVTELGASPENVRRPITPKQASDLGDRIILAPLSINPQLADDAVHKLARSFADGDRNGDGEVDSEPVNVVVLVPSDYAAKRWLAIADQILHVDTMREPIERMKNGHHLGLVVLVNKYDGVDLPAAACRLLIIDGIPTPLTPHERRASAALSGSSSFKAREVQKLEQGMGRGIRDVSDYCATLVLTSDAALTLRDPILRRYYSPATRAQIELSQQVAEQIEGEGISEISTLLNLFLERDHAWVGRSLAATADVTYTGDGSVTDLAISRRRAFDQAIAGDEDGAVRTLREGLDSIADPITKGWHMEELATYEHFVDDVASQKTIATARQMNSAVLKPAVPPSRKKIKGPAAQGRAASEFLSASYTGGRQMQLGIASVFDKIAWGVDHASDLAEEQFRLLGLHLGFHSSRPEKESKDGGPDNLWALTIGRFAVIELKTEVSRSDKRITKSEAEQIGHSMTWFSEVHPDAANATPVLVHPSESRRQDAHLPEGTRVITQDDLGALRTSTENFFNEVVTNESWTSPDSVADALKRNGLSFDVILSKYSRKPQAA